MSDYCKHGTFVGDPYGPDYICSACEDGLCKHYRKVYGSFGEATEGCAECGHEPVAGFTPKYAFSMTGSIKLDDGTWQGLSILYGKAYDTHAEADKAGHAAFDLFRVIGITGYHTLSVFPVAPDWAPAQAQRDAIAADLLRGLTTTTTE